MHLGHEYLPTKMSNLDIGILRTSLLTFHSYHDCATLALLLAAKKTTLPGILWNATNVRDRCPDSTSFRITSLWKNLRWDTGDRTRSPFVMHARNCIHGMACTWRDGWIHYGRVRHSRRLRTCRPKQAWIWSYRPLSLNKIRYFVTHQCLRGSSRSASRAISFRKQIFRVFGGYVTCHQAGNAVHCEAMTRLWDKWWYRPIA